MKTATRNKVDFDVAVAATLRSSSVSSFVDKSTNVVSEVDKITSESALWILKTNAFVANKKPPRLLSGGL